jgi:hypothetical protein
MLSIIPHVVPSRVVVVKQLGWLEGRRAETRPNFPANRDYVDLRGLTLADLDTVIEEERRAYALLEAESYAARAVETADRRRRSSEVAPMLDFGIASTVAALSALGCVPVMSCRGCSLGPHGHQYPAPMTTFYARKMHVPALLAAVEAADINIVNSGAKLEVYSEDLRKMHAFAVALRETIPAVSPR